MDVTHQTCDEHATLWNGRAGRAWVEAQDLLDQVFQPFEDLLVEAVFAGSGGRVLDVGCGTGSTTVAVARLLGAKGRCIGIDISEPMIAAARACADRERTPASFIHANAQIHAFEPASFDMIISRFGVMFFGDSVRAFANLRRAAADDGEFRFIAFRSAAENPFMTTAERAAAPVLPNLPARRPGCARAVRLRRPAPGLFHLGGERLDRDRYPAGRCRLYLSGEGIGPLPDPARSRRPGPSRGGRPDRTQVVETVRPAFDP